MIDLYAVPQASPPACDIAIKKAGWQVARRLVRARDKLSQIPNAPAEVLQVSAELWQAIDQIIYTVAPEFDTLLRDAQRDRCAGE
jgi:hypothetical protein